MEWSKIKNIVILILLLLNGILLVMVAKQEYDYRAYQQTARTEIIRTMETNGISLRPEDLPEDVSLPTLRLEQTSMEASPEQAAALLGPCEVVEEVSGVRVTYAGEGGRMDTFSNGRFSADLAPDAMPLDGTEPAEHGAYVLSLLSCEGELVSTVQKGVELVLTFRQVMNGVPVFSCEITLTYRDGALRRAEGQRLLGAASTSAQTRVISVPTLLLRFLSQRNESGQMFSKITGITAGYQLSAVRPFTLTPVWYIETDTGAYTLNGTDGTVLT